MKGVIVSFFKKSIPAPLVFCLFSGLLIGTGFGLSVPLIVLSHSEKVSSYEEVAAASMVEDALRLAGKANAEEAGFSYITGVQKYDGPRLAQSMPIETKEAWL